MVFTLILKGCFLIGEKSGGNEMMRRGNTKARKILQFTSAESKYMLVNENKRKSKVLHT
jgi:hypothetical protein